MVIVLPGIGGSVLSATDNSDSEIWDASPASVGRTLVDPTRLSVEEYPELHPTGLVRGATVLGRITILPGYAELVRSLCNLSGASSAVLTPDQLPDPQAEVLLFPYDFRLGVAAAAHRLAQAVHPLVGSENARWPGRPLLLIAHSMGGLVARYWIGPLAGWRSCAGLVTLGTPHRGAPKALDWLVNGVRYGRTWQRATNVLRGWPSAWDLVPRYQAIWHQDASRAVHPEELPADAVNATGLLAGTAAAVPAALSSGARTHSEIAAGWGDIPVGRAPAVHVVFSRGHATLSKGVLSGTNLRISKENPGWLPRDGWEGGDGTVPALSALPVELSEDKTVRNTVWQRHGPLGCSHEAARLLGEYETESVAAIRGINDPGITLDLDDFVSPGNHVSATLRNASPGSETALTLEARPVGMPPGPGRQWIGGRMAQVDGLVWQAELPVTAPGTYEVRVTATGVPLVSPPAATDLVEVLAEPDTAAEVDQ